MGYWLKKLPVSPIILHGRHNGENPRHLFTWEDPFHRWNGDNFAMPRLWPDKTPLIATCGDWIVQTPLQSEPFWGCKSNWIEMKWPFLIDLNPSATPNTSTSLPLPTREAISTSISTHQCVPLNCENLYQPLPLHCWEPEPQGTVYLCISLNPSICENMRIKRQWLG